MHFKTAYQARQPTFASCKTQPAKAADESGKASKHIEKEGWPAGRGYKGGSL
ncbi:hypothetical protein BACFIN_05729 [Bacteroides finegoldii DSM 17565]|nr:hypothetical protein BACFIN_05729 [Bacteroides finegoldii DSM 17565]